MPQELIGINEMNDDAKTFTTIGLMSGTSLDGIDAALIRTDGHNQIEPLGFVGHEYSNTTRDVLRGCFNKTEDTDGSVAKAATLLTEEHIKAVKRIMRELELTSDDIDLIGFHGQTISHDPDNGFTWQIGDADMLAQETGIDVVADFRTNDVKNGGQGAPLIPLYHQARVAQQELQRPLAFLNIGGVGNVTWLGKNDDDVLAFDTGPGNALIDDFVKSRTGLAYDKDGILARTGETRVSLLNKWMDDAYFKVTPPKSLDRNAWNVKTVESLTDEDGAATLTAFTVQAILAAIDHMPEKPAQWLVAGGGRLNPAIMEMLQAHLDAPVDNVDTLGWNGDAFEAQAFAWLGVRSLLGLPLSLPTTTGVSSPMTGGVLHKAQG